MLRTWFANPWSFYLLAIVPVWGVLAWMARRRRRWALVRFGTLPAVRTLAAMRGGLAFLRPLCFLIGVLLLIGGIAGPRWGWDWEQSVAPGRDIVIVLDVSRSMLARDVLPNRVERARQAVNELSRTIEQRGGHRLGLVAFASGAKIVCPLTHDYEHFRLALANLDVLHLPAELRPDGKTSLSGTRIGAGLRAAVEAHDPQFRGAQDIILISDGDDPARDAEEELRTGIAAARGINVPGGRNIPVHTVGVGNPQAGATIPIKDDAVLRHNNQIVTTRLKELPLEMTARLTGGVYIPARTNALPLGELFREHIDSAGKHEENDENLPVRRLQYSWFLAGAFTFLGFEAVMGQRRTRRLRRLAKDTARAGAERAA
jgi:Ca-activated chloride channel family protein